MRPSRSMSSERSSPSAEGARPEQAAAGARVGLGDVGSAPPSSRVWISAATASQAEHWAGGTTSAGGLAAPLLALHSTDGGKTWANEDNGVKGQMITAMSFPSAAHGYATTVNALQICSLLEYS